MPGVDNSITLLQSRITDFQARIDPKEKQIALKVNLSAQYKKVLDEKELRGIIRIQAIISGEEKDEFY